MGLGSPIQVRNLAVALWTEVNTARRTKRSSSVAQALFAVVDRLVRISTRLIATYSRQDEFAADRGAAGLCGAGVMKSALSRLEALHRITSRLPWNERVAQLQQPGGYSQWLLQEIAQGLAPQAAEVTDVWFNQYSTHPSIPDRLAALPVDDKLPAPDSPSAIQLLSHPDYIAVKLLTELQRLMAEQERKDSRVLEKFSRKTGRQAHLRPGQTFGFLLILGGVICGLIGLAAGDTLELVAWSLAAIVAGILAFRLGKYRDSLELPVPPYEKIIQPSPGKAAQENAPAKESAIQAELSKLFDRERRATRAWRLAEESYAALKRCDYFRAHVAARACLALDKKSTEGALALAVACAAFGQIRNTAQLLALVQKQTGLKTFPTAWGAAWAGLLAGDWIRAEAMLEQALKLQPQQPTLVSLLALAQSQRGKLQSSIANARRACELHPESREKLKFLLGRLLDGGFTREAQERMRPFSLDLETDPDLILYLVQFHLLQRNFAEADRWLARLKQTGASAPVLIRLARLYETARRADGAAALYQEALATDHYPEAHLGLSRIETERNHKVEARSHLLAALNVERPVGREGATTWQILQPILTQMLWQQEPVAHCRAWLATFPGNSQPAPLAGQSLMIYASDLPQAQAHFQTMMNALQPGKPPAILNPDNWKAAPRPMQPDGPVRPGVQGLWN